MCIRISFSKIKKIENKKVERVVDLYLTFKVSQYSLFFFIPTLPIGTFPFLMMLLHIDRTASLLLFLLFLSKNVVRLSDQQ